MAIRPRLKSRTGCHNCRDRRVKCDEIKPSCSRCTKWKLKCEWPNLATLDNTHATSSSSTTTPLLPVSTSLRTSDSSLSDKKGLDSKFIAKTKLAPMFDERGISVTDTEFQNILIEGIRDGWTNTRVKYYLDLRWSSFIATMDYLELCGHGLSSRLSAGWNMRLLSRHMSSRDDSLLPSWWIPKEKAPSHLAFANFAPWPNIRAVLMRATYLTTSVKFKFDWSRSGVQFIWPYSFEDAYVKHEGGLRMSDEFVMRLANLRSYATTKHFLDLYPDFRGEMPQLEPSPTLYTPLMTNRLEELYWRKVRERRKQRLRRRSERETVSPEEPAQDYMSIVLGRPPDRSAHTSQTRFHNYPPTR